MKYVFTTATVNITAYSIQRLVVAILALFQNKWVSLLLLYYNINQATTFRRWSGP